MRTRRTATVSDIAKHWAVTADTARSLLNKAGIPPVSTTPTTYRWADIWSYEGSGWVAPRDEAAFKAPLLAADEIDDFFPDTPERTTTDRAEKKKIPAIRIGKQWRFRTISLERWQDNV